MGRPKKSELFCTTCNRAFSRKSDLQKHMTSHLDSNEETESYDQRQARVRSNWCAPCKKSFEDSEYKLHIQTEHQFDLHENNMDDSDDDEHFPYESGYVLLSKKRIKKEPETESRILLSDIKIEPMSEEDSCSSVPKKKKAKLKRTYLVNCPICGVECKGPRALKSHQEFKHKNRKSSKTLLSDDQSLENEEDVDNPSETEMSSIEASNYSPIPIANMSGTNINQNTSGLYNMHIPHNTNGQVSSISTNEQVKLLEIIPTFNCNSEEYTMWLKKFVQKCKNHKYPLPQFLCDNINHVQYEIASALNKPSGNLKKKSCHFYFMKMHEILTEVLLGHMRHKMSVTK